MKKMEHTFLKMYYINSVHQAGEVKGWNLTLRDELDEEENSSTQEKEDRQKDSSWGNP